MAKQLIDIKKSTGVGAYEEDSDTIHMSNGLQYVPMHLAAPTVDFGLHRTTTLWTAGKAVPDGHSILLAWTVHGLPAQMVAMINRVSGKVAPISARHCASAARESKEEIISVCRERAETRRSVCAR